MIQEDSKSGKVDWPYRVPAYAPGDVIERSLEVFNGGLSGASFALRYTAHWDAPGGPIAVAAPTTDSLLFRSGFHVARSFGCRAAVRPAAKGALAHPGVPE